EKSVIWKPAVVLALRFQNTFKGPQCRNSHGPRTSEAFGHGSSDGSCSFLCPTASGLKQVGESFPGYEVEPGVWCACSASRPPVTVLAATALVKAHLRAGLLSELPCGFPTVAVSIGFAVNQELEFGVIYHCTEERLYTGRRGRGAFCNGQRLRVSGETDISKALVLTEIGPKRDPATLKLFLSNMERLLHAKAHGVRVIGSSTLALCHLASGAADAYYQFGLHCWDLAAATVIIREAGGIVMDTSGGPLDLMSCRVVAAGTREMATLIAQALQTINYGRDDEK
uniref:Inositol-1-monophosphatase n=2 Tax=Canis lupus TaxID=9612 RepID=A0A8C0S476_CANLF